MNTRFPAAAAPILRLVDEFNKLPGIGPKSAQRLTYFLLRSSKEQAQALAEAILAIKEKTFLCGRCQNITDVDPCLICSSADRDQSVICVVQEPLDILALERTRSYTGIYHVLHGSLSPMDNIGPDDLKIKELLARLQDGLVKEVILAMDYNVEGDSTAMYLWKLLSTMNIKITRLARGLSYGSNLEYADDMTLSRALEGRQEVPRNGRS